MGANVFSFRGERTFADYLYCARESYIVLSRIRFYGTVYRGTIKRATLDHNTNLCKTYVTQHAEKVCNSVTCSLLFLSPMFNFSYLPPPLHKNLIDQWQIISLSRGCDNNAGRAKSIVIIQLYGCTFFMTRGIISDYIKSFAVIKNLNVFISRFA